MAKFTPLLVFVLFSFFSISAFSQAQVDLDKSVPVWMEYNSTDNEAVLKWILDDQVANYTVSEVTPPISLSTIASLDGTAIEFPIGPIAKGEIYNYHLRKNTGGTGIINIGQEIPVTHQRGRCLIAIDDILVGPLVDELVQLIQDIEMDGWEVDTIHTKQSDEVTSVKSRISEWHVTDYEGSQSLFLLGHVPVPYSGNSAHDGHGNHQGAWAADVYYAELDGNWTDVSVNNTSPSRPENKNIPGDGKFDQTFIPTTVELEVGRVDFNNLPAFTESEIELTRQYLVKNHDFKIGNKEYPRRALVENNFGSFAEGFGQSGWRNFATMFGGDSVTTKNYDVVLATDKYLFSYACGGGSYTSCAGIGTTANLWVAKDIQTIFTLNFGSYFGDWDSQNNFLRSALASGDVLTNAWAGRPAWHLYDMALGKHIGYSTRLTHNASSGFYNSGFSSKSAHIALMGDPTLRLHAMKKANDLVATFTNGDIVLTWTPSPDANDGHIVYRQKDGAQWELIAEVSDENMITDVCVSSNTEYNYMVKAVRLEQSGSGSYFNTSLGISKSILTSENLNLVSYYADVDMDGFGNVDSILISCAQPIGFVENDLDCDDNNPDINPEGLEIPNNDIDEDCDGSDLIVGISELDELNIQVFPNPTSGIISITGEQLNKLTYRLFDIRGTLIRSGNLKRNIDLSDQADGLFWIEVRSLETGTRQSELLQLVK